MAAERGHGAGPPAHRVEDVSVAFQLQGRRSETDLRELASWCYPRCPPSAVRVACALQSRAYARPGRHEHRSAQKREPKAERDFGPRRSAGKERVPACGRPNHRLSTCPDADSVIQWPGGWARGRGTEAGRCRGTRWAYSRNEPADDCHTPLIVFTHVRFSGSGGHAGGKTGAVPDSVAGRPDSSHVQPSTVC